MGSWPTEAIADCLQRLRPRDATRLQTQYYKDSGTYPIIDQGQRLIAGWTDDDSGLIVAELPVVVFGDHTRALKYVDFPFVRGADGTQILKPKAGIAPLFFYYACRAIDLPSRGYNRHFKALKEQKIPLPPPGEQKTISLSLKLIDDALALQDNALRAADAAKRAAMQALFTRGLRGEAQKETEIGPMPESWDVVDFSAVREWLQYGTSTHCTYEETCFPVLRIPNIEPGRVNARDLKFGKLRADEANRYRLEAGDLIFIRTNGVIERLGACAVFAGEPQTALFASYLIRARLKKNAVNPYFVAYFFASGLGTNLIAGRATPASDGKYNLNTGTIDSLPMPLPPSLDEQREIVAILDAIDRKIDLHRRKRTVLDELFKALLHKLMTGDICAADLDLTALGAAGAAEAAA